MAATFDYILRDSYNKSKLSTKYSKETYHHHIFSKTKFQVHSRCCCWNWSGKSAGKLEISPWTGGQFQVRRTDTMKTPPMLEQRAPTNNVVEAKLSLEKLLLVLSLFSLFQNKMGAANNLINYRRDCTCIALEPSFSALARIWGRRHRPGIEVRCDTAISYQDTCPCFVRYVHTNRKSTRSSKAFQFTSSQAILQQLVNSWLGSPPKMPPICSIPYPFSTACPPSIWNLDTAKFLSCQFPQWTQTRRCQPPWLE